MNNLKFYRIIVIINVEFSLKLVTLHEPYVHTLLRCSNP